MWNVESRKRDTFGATFQQFDRAKVARFGEREIARLVEDPGMSRSRAKSGATIGGTRAILEMQQAEIDFPTWIWDPAGGQSIPNVGPVPAGTPLAAITSLELKRCGFKFVGSVIVCAWMQTTGIVNDKASDCFRRSVRARKKKNR